MITFRYPISPGIRCKERFDGILLRKSNKNKIPDEKLLSLRKDFKNELHRISVQAGFAIGSPSSPWR